MYPIITMIKAIDSQIISALIGGISGIACAAITAWMTNRYHRKQKVADKAKNAAYLTSKIAPALRDYAADCFLVSYDDGHSEGQPAGKDGTATITVKSPTFIPSNFSVEWTSLQSNLMIDVLTFQEHSREEASMLNDFHCYYDPPDHKKFFLDRQHIYAQLGIQALSLSERLYEHTQTSPNMRGSELKKLLSDRLEEVNTLRSRREKRMHQCKKSPDDL